ncbi:MAG: efflux RND transporter periplasmic adaptor subunit [Bacteroidota bacterium]
MKRINQRSIFLLLMFLLISACGSKKDSLPGSPKKQLRKVATLAITPSTITKKVNITGMVVAQKKLDVVPQVQGIALATKPVFKEGIRFRKGQTMVAIDDAAFRSILTAQKSQFVSLLVKVMSDLKMDYPTEFPNWERYLNQLDINKSLPILPEVTEKQLHYFLSVKNILDSYYSIKSQEETLKDYTIEAQYDGVVTQDNFNVGSLISPGVKLGSFLHTGAYEVRATVSLTDLANIQQINELRFTSNETKQEWKGTLDRVAEKVDENSQSVNVYFRLEGEGLKENMYVESELEAHAFANAVELSKGLVTRDDQVFVLNDSLIQLKPVKPLAYTNSTIIVSGLQKGDLVISEVIKSTLQGTKAVTLN